MEIHKRSKNEDIPKSEELEEILERHLSFPLCYTKNKRYNERKGNGINF